VALRCSARVRWMGLVDSEPLAQWQYGRDNRLPFWTLRQPLGEHAQLWAISLQPALCWGPGCYR